MHTEMYDDPSPSDPDPSDPSPSDPSPSDLDPAGADPASTDSAGTDSAAAEIGEGTGGRVFDASAIVAGLSVFELLALQDAAETRLQTCGETALALSSDDAVLDVLETRETTSRRREIFNSALYAEVSDRRVYRLAGHHTTHQLYACGLRLGGGEAQRRRIVAEATAPLTGLTGEKLAPALPASTTALAQGLIGREHILVIAQIMNKIPATVDPADRDTAEAMLAEAAATLDPVNLTAAGNRILAHLDPDGTLTDDTERQHRRSLSIQAQNRQLLSKVRAMLTPLLRATLETTLHLWAAAGMNNPDDPDSPHGTIDQPGLDQAALAAAAARDHRTHSQRQHDGLLAALSHLNSQTATAASGNNIASQIVVTVSDEDLARGTGVAYTATGTRLPIGDLVALAADTIAYLAVFAGATSQVLYLGRSRRLATKAQRLALFARDRGCTAPGCTQPFIRTQAHHMPDWTNDGHTDIDHLGGACGPHNRAGGTQPGTWESTILPTGPHTGRVAWRPAGRNTPWTINPMFHPEKLNHRPPPPGLPDRLTAPPPQTPHAPPDDTGPPAAA